MMDKPMTLIGESITLSAPVIPECYAGGFRLTEDSHIVFLRRAEPGVFKKLMCGIFFGWVWIENPDFDGGKSNV